MVTKHVKSLDILTSPQTTATTPGGYGGGSDGSDPAGQSPPSGRTPMSERQQMALLMQLTSPESIGSADLSSVRRSVDGADVSRTPSGRAASVASSRLQKRNRRGETPLQVAAIRGDLPRVRQLLDDGADVDVTDFAGWTPLHEACIHGWTSVVRALLTGGAQPNRPGPDGVTALHDAAGNDRRRAVRLLLRHGADPTLSTRDGRTALQLCSSPRVLRLLQRHLRNPQQQPVSDSDGEDKENRGGGSTDSVRRGGTSVGGGRLLERIGRLTLDMEPASSGVAAGVTSDKSALDSEQPAAGRGGFSQAVGKSSPTGSCGRGSPSSVEAAKEVSTDKTTGSSEDGKRMASEMQDSDAVDEGAGKKRKKKDETAVVTGKTAGGGKNGKGGDKAGKAGGKSSIQGKSSKGSSGGSSGERRSPAGSPSRGRTAGADAESDDSDASDTRPKVPPLKIVINATSEAEPSKNGKGAASSRLPYVVASQEEAGSPAGVSDAVMDTGAVPSPAGSVQKEVDSSQPTGVDEAAGAQHDGDGADAPSRITRSQRALQTGSGGSNSGTPSPTSGLQTPAAAVSTAEDVTTAVNPPVVAGAATTGESAAPPAASVVAPAVQTVGGNPVVPSAAAALSNVSQQPSYSSAGPSQYQQQQSAAAVTQILEHPRKRRFRQARAAHQQAAEAEHAAAASGAAAAAGSTASTSVAATSCPSGVAAPSDSPVAGVDPPFTNNYKMYEEIRRQVERRRRELFPISPKPPRGFKDYLINRGTYVLAGNAQSRLSVPTMAPPTSLAVGMNELFSEQELERYKLRLQHIIEKEKLVLSVEQEILRVHGRAARALANQAVPFSVCSMLKDEEVYNLATPEQEEKDRNVRDRYNGRQFFSWLQDVDDKWEKIKEGMILRHHNEAEALHAVQKMDWVFKLKEVGVCEARASPQVDELHVPMVKVIDDFDMPPS